MVVSQLRRIRSRQSTRTPLRRAVRSVRQRLLTRVVRQHLQTRVVRRYPVATNPIQKRLQLQRRPIRLLTKRSMNSGPHRRTTLRRRLHVKSPVQPSPPQPPAPPPQARESSESFYRGKIQPVYESVDLFDKHLRAHVVGNYILKYNDHYSSLLKPSSEFEQALPKQLGKVFVISIRPERLMYFRRRMGPWSKHVELWPGVDGAKLDKNQMLKDGTLKPSTWHQRSGELTIRRGEIGAYMAHYTLWQHIAKLQLPFATIMEDDADICYSKLIVERVKKMFADLDHLQMNPDMIYFGHNDYNAPEKRFEGTEIAIPNKCQGFFTYRVTLDGVQKLLSIAMPIGLPIDIHVMSQRHIVQQVSMEPRLNWVVDVWSDSNNIV